MPIPIYPDLIIPVLKLLHERDGQTINDLKAVLGNAIGLTDEEMRQLVPNSSKTLFGGRIKVALDVSEAENLVISNKGGRRSLTQAARVAFDRGDWSTAELLTERKLAYETRFVMRSNPIYTKRSSISDQIGEGIGAILFYILLGLAAFGLIHSFISGRHGPPLPYEHEVDPYGKRPY